jgi:hypothetical protein
VKKQLHILSASVEEQRMTSRQLTSRFGAQHGGLIVMIRGVVEQALLSVVVMYFKYMYFVTSCYKDDRHVLCVRRSRFKLGGQAMPFMA